MDNQSKLIYESESIREAIYLVFTLCQWQSKEQFKQKAKTIISLTNKETFQYEIDDILTECYLRIGHDQAIEKIEIIDLPAHHIKIEVSNRLRTESFIVYLNDQINDYVLVSESLQKIVSKDDEDFPDFDLASISEAGIAQLQDIYPFAFFEDIKKIANKH